MDNTPYFLGSFALGNREREREGRAYFEVLRKYDRHSGWVIKLRLKMEYAAPT